MVGAPDRMPVGGDFECHFMGRLEWVLVMSPKLPLADLKEPLTSEQLIQYRALCVHDTSRIFEGRYTWFLNNQERFYCPNIGSVLEAAIQGFGITFLPHFLVADDVKKGKLVVRDIINPKQPSNHYVGWPSRSKGKAIKWCKKYFKDPDQAKRWL